MPITIGSNIPSLIAQRQLAKGTRALTTSFERLSSGMRINRASDDPAGLAVSMRLLSDARVFTQAARNINDGVSMINVADSALEALGEITSRQLELAEQAANGTYTLAQRRAMNLEANALVQEFNRIVQSTKFNDIALLDVSASRSVAIQLGIGAANVISVDTTALLDRTVGTGTFGGLNNLTSAFGNTGLQVLLADFNGDGNVDIFGSEGSFYAGNGDGTFRAAVAYAAGGNNAVSGDFNGDGRLDVVVSSSNTTTQILLGNGDGSFRAPVNYTTGTSVRKIIALDFNGDGKLDFAQANNLENTFSVSIGNGDGSFRAPRSYATLGVANRSIASADLNSDGELDILVGSPGGTISMAFGNGDGTFRQATSMNGGGGSANDIQIGDFNGDGLADIVTGNYAATGSFSILLGNGNGTFQAAKTYSAPDHTDSIIVSDFNGDGIEDIAAGNSFGTSDGIGIALGNGDGTFRATVSFAVAADPYNLGVGDLNNDGVVDLVSSDATGAGATISFYLQNTTQTSTTPILDLLSQSSALESIGILQATLDRIVQQRGSIGASQARLETALNTVHATVENYRIAAGRITDVDVAAEAAELVRNRILQQAASAVLAQANQQPAIVLKLLQ